MATEMADSPASAVDATAEPSLHLALSTADRRQRESFRRWVDEHVVPHADTWDREAAMPRSILEPLRAAGYLGAPLAAEIGGGGMDPVVYGLLTEEIGRGCSSLRSLLTVHDMVTTAVARWGKPALREEHLGPMARGERLGALALSEPNIGSDAAGVETSYRRDGDDFVLTGTKRWITFGRWADCFLVLARDAEGDKLAAFLVPATTAGVSRTPIRVAGTRASMVAQIQFDDVRLSLDHLLARPGFGLSYVVTTALDLGRYSVAWGSVGIARAALEASVDYCSKRRQFGQALDQHQLVQRKLTDMIADTQAARLLCARAGTLRRLGDPNALPETMLAKYVASRAAVRAAGDAIQLHGANGLSEDFPLTRYLRDAKVTEIIEGSTQLMQTMLPRYPLPEL